MQFVSFEFLDSIDEHLRHVSESFNFVVYNMTMSKTCGYKIIWREDDLITF